MNNLKKGIESLKNSKERAQLTNNFFQNFQKKLSTR